MKLDDWMWETRRKNVDLARELGIGPPHVSGLRSGKVRPSLEIAAKIQRLSNGKVTAVDLEEAYTGPKADAALAAA